MASIRDVAKKAGVAASTVSRALNGSGYVSNEARERIEKAMEELAYVPNELARNLFRNRTGLVGIMVPDIAHPFFGTFTRYAEMALYERGYKTMLCSTVQESGREQEYLDMLRRSMMDGIIIGSHSLDIGAYRDIGRPVVSFDREIGARIPIVGADHRKGGWLAAKELLRCGCRQVVQVMGARIVSTPAHQHHIALQHVLADAGVKVDTFEMEWNRFDLPYYMQVAQRVLEAHPHADAIFASDLVVGACIRVALRQGRRIPGELRLIAYDGTYVTDLMPLRPTAIVQPLPALAQAAVSALLSLIEGEAPAPVAPLDVTLREGETTP